MRRTRRSALLFASAVALVVGACGNDGGHDASPTTTTTSPSTTSAMDTTSTTGPTTTTSTATERPAVDRSVLWPAPGSAQRFGSPEEAAESFATSFLRFEAPVVGAFRRGDGRSGEVPIRPRRTGPETTLLVRQVDADDRWSVLGATTQNLEVTAPAALAEIASPVHVTGRALAFEGHVSVEVRADGDLAPIGDGYVLGGGDVMRPFDGMVAFETPRAPLGAVVFTMRSAENGEVWQAAAVRVALRSTDVDARDCNGYRSPHPLLAAGEMEVKAYFTCDAADVDDVRPVYRAVPKSVAVLRASLGALLSGPTPSERSAGITSFFSDSTKDMLRSAELHEGHAVVDLHDLRAVIPNASASAGSRRLLAELDATVFQFRTVRSVEYRIEGSCEAFNEWLQFGGCEPRTRPASSD